MTYLIQSPHTADECLKVLDEHLAKGTDVLEKMYFGCKSGDHTGYAIVDVKSEQEARSMIPSFLAGKTRIVEVGKFTPEEIKAFHKAA